MWLNDIGQILNSKDKSERVTSKIVVTPKVKAEKGKRTGNRDFAAQANVIKIMSVSFLNFKSYGIYNSAKMIDSRLKYSSR